MFISVVLVGVLVGREPAKMRPSKDLTTCGRWVRGSSWVVVGNGGAALWAAWLVLQPWVDRVTGTPPGHPW